MSLAYEKMYLIDEANYVRLKGGDVPPGAGDDDDDDAPMPTLEQEPDDTFSQFARHAGATSSPIRAATPRGGRAMALDSPIRAATPRGMGLEEALELEDILNIENEERQQVMASLSNSDMSISELLTYLNETNSSIQDSSLEIERLEDAANRSRAKYAALEEERRRAQEEELEQRMAEEQAQEIANAERLEQAAREERERLAALQQEHSRLQQEQLQLAYFVGLRRQAVEQHWQDLNVRRAAQHVVDLDADMDDPVEQAALLKRIFPNPVLAQMNVQEQVEATHELLNRTPQEVQDISNTLYESFQSEVGNTMQYSSDDSIIGLARAQ